MAETVSFSEKISNWLNGSAICLAIGIGIYKNFIGLEFRGF
jgi:hypothetical protein